MQQDGLRYEQSLPTAEAAGAGALLQSLGEDESVETAPPQEQAETAEALGAALSQESRNLRRSILRYVGAFSAFGVAMIAVKLAIGKEEWEALLLSQLFVSATLSSLLLFSLFAVITGRGPRQRRRSLTSRVADRCDVRSIGPLIEALRLDDSKTREIAISALIDVLPRLKANEAALLSESDRSRLRRLLSLPIESALHKDVRALFQPTDSRAVAFRVAILQAFEQVGDARALPIVKYLAAKEPRTDGERRLREAAEACLPALELRLEKAGKSQMLLRASHPNSASPDTLLRAPAESPGVAPEELLRAGESVALKPASPDSPAEATR